MHYRLGRCLLSLGLASVTLAMLAPLSGCRQVIKSAARAGSSNSSSSTRTSESGDSVTSVRADDPEMLAAIAKARQTVDTFTVRLANPRRGDEYSVKVAVRDGEQVEHFWMTDVTFDGSEFHGKLSNEPMLVSNVKMGQAWHCPMNEISDWMIISQRRLTGGYTLRVLRDRMSQAERAKFDKESGLQF